MKTPVFTGSNVALVTPFDKSGINYGELDRLIEYHISNGTNSITVCGTTGETCTLSDYEHRKVLSFCIEKVNGRIPVIAGTGSNDTMYSIELSKFAAAEKADGLLVVTPYYNKTTQKGLIKHFNMVADSTNLPLILYNVPSRTGISFKPETYKELSLHPNINGVKEASGDFSLIAASMELCGDELYFWSGNDDQIVPLMAMGGVGVISVFANICPNIARELTDACLRGDFSEATKLQLKYLQLINSLFIEVNPIPVKTALGLMGFDVGELRMPLCEMSECSLEILKANLKAHNII